MGYPTLENSGGKRKYVENGLEASALRFIRERCENLRFDDKKSADEKPEEKIFGGKQH